MIWNIDTQRRIRDDFGLEITGDGERSKGAKEGKQRRRILHLIFASNARITSRPQLLSFLKDTKQVPPIPHVNVTSAGPAMTTLLITSGGLVVVISIIAAASTSTGAALGGLATVTTPRVDPILSCVKFRMTMNWSP
jgi:hypothetical protein